MSKTKSISFSYKLFVVLTLFFASDFFGFTYYVPFFGNRFYQNDVSFFFLGVLDVLFLAYFVFFGKLKKGDSETHLFSALFFIAIFSLIVSYSRYKQNIFQLLKASMYYFVPVLSIFTFRQFHFSQVKKNYFINMMVAFSIVCTFIAIVVFLLYEVSGINILHLDSSFSRYGSIRFGVGEILVVFSSLYLFYKIVKAKRFNFKDWLALSLLLFQIVFFIKSRTLTLFLLCSFAIFFLSYRKLWGYLLFIFPLFFSFLIIGWKDITQYLMNYVEGDAGIMVRFSAISYYLSIFTKYPLLGVGFTDGSSIGSILSGGIKGKFYRSDVGWFGLLNTFGLVGVVWALAFLIFYFRKGIVEKNHFLLICLFYLSLSSVNLQFMDINRTMYLFFIFVFSQEDETFMFKKNLVILKNKYFIYKSKCVYQ